MEAIEGSEDNKAANSDRSFGTPSFYDIILRVEQTYAGTGGKMDKKELMRVWNQHEIPVILRRTDKGPLLRMRLPYADSNRTPLQDGRRISQFTFLPFPPTLVSILHHLGLPGFRVRY